MMKNLLANRQALSALKIELKAQLATEGLSFDERIYKLAYTKARRWAKYAYGNTNDYWLNYHQEGGDLMVYYKECLEMPNGSQTHNRQIGRNAAAATRARKRGF